MPVVVYGMREVSAAFAQAEKQARAAYRSELRDLGRPVAEDAEALAKSNIRTVGPRWYRMRVGVTKTEVYVVPRERGLKTRGDDPHRRPKFGKLMMDRAMVPALKRNEHEIERMVERMFDQIADTFNAGGAAL